MIPYYIFLNMVGFLTMGVDKWKAKHHRWRILEKSLHIIIWTGGMFGIWMGMILFHHKTKKKIFYLSISGSCILHLTFLYIFIKTPYI